MTVGDAFVTDDDVFPTRHLAASVVAGRSDDERVDFRLVCDASKTVDHDDVSKVDRLPEGVCSRCRESVHAAFLRGIKGNLPGP